MAVLTTITDHTGKTFNLFLKEDDRDPRKAGDLANWRSLSLASSDARVFTNVRRLQPHMKG